MSKLLKPKVSIIGAGNVGVRYAYALVQSGFAREIMLVDSDRAKAEGEVMDLSHGAPFVSPVEIFAGGYSDISSSDLVVITAGKKQKPGQSRIELVNDNISLYKTIIPEIVKYAPEAILLCVTNPVDILAYAAFKISGKPAKSVISSGTVLDSARFKFELSRHFNVDAHNVHAYVLGEHGDTEFPVWSSAMIGGILVKDYCLKCREAASCDHQKKLDEIFTGVRDSAYKIIQKKGETSYGIGLALVRITRAILKDENSILPVSTLANGFLGVNDVYLGLPAVLNKEGVREVLEINLDAEEQKNFLKSATSLKSVIKQTGM